VNILKNPINSLHTLLCQAYYASGTFKWYDELRPNIRHVAVSGDYFDITQILFVGCIPHDLHVSQHPFYWTLYHEINVRIVVVLV